ncbi:MAG TPA: hypothetical protein VF762_12970 [Blastocatellia bacterium]
MSSQKNQQAMQSMLGRKSVFTWVLIAGLMSAVWAVAQTMNIARIDERDSKIRKLESQIQELQRDRELTAQPSFGEYEWQWAGDNLIGTVSIKKNPEGKDVALVDMRKIVKNFDIVKQPDGTFAEIDEGFKSQEAMISTGDGAISGNKSAFKLTLPVLRNIFDSRNKKVGEVRQILEADLTSVEAYAGKVKFVYLDKSVKTGDMVLVRYNSGTGL